MDESLLQNQISPPAHSTSKYKRKRGLFEGDLGSDDDQFESVPYMNNAVKLVLFWIGVVLSGGWLGLFVLWFPRFWFPLTKTRCHAVGPNVSCFTIKQRKHYTNVYVQDDGTKRWFEFHCLRYIYDPQTNVFTLVNPMQNFKLYDVHSLSTYRGLSSAECRHRYGLLGSNILNVPIPSLARSLAVELLQPFYVYTYFASALWFYDDYAYYAAVIVFMTVASAVATVWFTRRNQQNIQRMVARESRVLVWRDGTWTAVSSGELVPGDILQLSDGEVVPADVVLVSGEAVTDEAMLTGESIPVRKFPVPLPPHPGAATGLSPLPTSEPADNPEYSPVHHKRHTLFMGTQVVKVSAKGPFIPEGEGRVVGFVHRTGFTTLKGDLIRKILFPSPVKFKYDREVVWVMLFMVVAAMASFAVSLRFWGGVGTVGTWRAVVFGLEIVTILLPVILPFVLNTGQVAAAVHLKQHRIYCISPPRIIMSGKIRVMCFDKTGTLTKDGLDVVGLVPAVRGRIDSELRPPSLADPPLRHIMATCHSVTMLHGRPTGHPVDVAMFAASGWLLRDTPHGMAAVAPDQSQELLIERTFEFEHALARMSVVVAMADGSRAVFTKGSAESIASICVPESLPSNLVEAVKAYSSQGGYVLAIATRPLESTADVATMPRRDVEQRLAFTGLIVFQNLLKDDTASVLGMLRRGDIRPVMVTGDNLYTAIAIARAAGMLGPRKRVLLGDVAEGARSVSWTDMATGEDVELSSPMLAASEARWAATRSLRKRMPRDDVFAFRLMEEGRDQPEGGCTPSSSGECEFELALTGKAFHTLLQSRGLNDVLLHTRVFARMTPDQKAKLVKAFIARGLVTGMCGDGCNDSAALRAAHAGISLSEAEASVVSPFTSRDPSIRCVVALICEGRSALVSSFSAFKAVLVSYAVIMHIAVLILYYFGSDMGEMMYVLQDIVLIFPLSTLMVRPNARNELQPRRPTASLLSPTTLCSLIGQSAIAIAALSAVALYVDSRPWFEGVHEYTQQQEKYWVCPETTSMFLLSNFLYIGAYISFSLGTDFTRQFWHNYLFVAGLAFAFAISFFLFFARQQWLLDFMEMYDLPRNYRYMLLVFCIVGLLAQILYERVLVIGPVSNFIRARFARRDVELEL